MLTAGKSPFVRHVPRKLCGMNFIVVSHTQVRSRLLADAINPCRAPDDRRSPARAGVAIHMSSSVSLFVCSSSNRSPA